MKINFVSFLDPYKFHGGGELDNRMLLEEGRRMGIDIRRAARVSNKYLHRIYHPKFRLHKHPDLWILSDLFNVPEYGLTYRKNFLENIIHTAPFIHLDNAYVDICSSGPLPCGGNRDRCGKACGNPLSFDLYSRSILNVFLSPLHARTINQYFNNQFLDKSFIVRPLVSTTKFVRKEVQKDIDFIYVGTISKYKGYDNLKQRFGKEKNFLFIGKNATGEQLFGKHIEHIQNEELGGYLNRARNFVHLPAWKEPMGRTVIEAALCGCKIISNENVGACSFDFDISQPVNIEGSAVAFWQKLKSLSQTKTPIHA
jgi:glycosyltransferase involved in cell wall biosynthesis